MGVMQHHDAITGTEKQHVSDDYNRLHYAAIDACADNVKFALTQLASHNSGHKTVHHHRASQRNTIDFEMCLNLNISQCDVSEKASQFVVTVYNPLARSISKYARIPVANGAYSIRDHLGNSVPSQLVPISASIANIHYRISEADYELVFLAEALPAVGYRSYFIARENQIRRFEMRTQENDEFSIGNQFVDLKFDANGQLKEFSANGVSNRLHQQFYYYEGAAGNNGESKNRSSGAYIFRPNNTERLLSEKVSVKVVRGPIVQEVHQVCFDMPHY